LYYTPCKALYKCSVFDAGSPVKHTVKTSAAVAVFGDGLMTACQGKTASFVVNTKGQRGELVVHVDGKTFCP